MYVYCMEICMNCTYSMFILYTSVCPLVVQSYTIYDETVNPLTPTKYTVLNGNLVFNLCDFDGIMFFKKITLA